MNNSELTIFDIDSEILAKLEQIRKEMAEEAQEIAREKTPEYDANHKQVIKPKGNTGYNYIEETFMRAKMDEHFPGWSWEMAAPLHFLGSEWVVAQGHLIIPVPKLLAFGINPPVRRFYGVDSVRIQYKQGTEHRPENIIDVGDNCKQANTAAMKYAINRGTRIGDDVYGKRAELGEGAGSIEEIIELHPTQSNLRDFIKKHNIKESKVFEWLEVKGYDEITDVLKAIEIIKQKRGIQ